ncbi:hypothetical protein FKW77_005649 [Venturia effusa]|uniref:SGNH hydrolase-type esterase domain-containing protein n=1 Tax=Venturia effusa TaxID=50376 RepID=A0A517L1D9_9PEZI|nr:hypothetical protein FKW77_005649 [Venturia effusa]
MVHLSALFASALLACTALANPSPAPAEANEVSELQRRQGKPPFFILIGDSTTAPVQAWRPNNTPPGGGGWGDGFLGTLNAPAGGLNLGHNGQDTLSYRVNGFWKEVIGNVTEKSKTHDIFCTVQFGHNDQKVNKAGVRRVGLNEYEKNLIAYVTELRALKVADVILVTPLTRRSFNKAGALIDDLSSESIKTKEAAATVKTTVIDLNAASRKYVQAVGLPEITKVNADYRNVKDLATSSDRTHLNGPGSLIFGRIVSDLITAALPPLGARWIKKDAPLSQAIAAGKLPLCFSSTKGCPLYG